MRLRGRASARMRGKHEGNFLMALTVAPFLRDPLSLVVRAPPAGKGFLLVALQELRRLL